MKRHAPKLHPTPALLLAVLLPVLTVVFLATPATAQTAGTVCIFADAQGVDCTGLSDTQAGLMQIYVVHTQATDVTSVEFSAPISQCMTDVVWLGDSSPWPLVVGDSQTGAAVSYGTCQSSPVHVMTISLFGQGLSESDCPYSVRPHPLSNSVKVTDCSNGVWDVIGGTTFINSTQDCWCDAGAGAELQLSPAYLDFEVVHNSLDFDITNVGAGVLTWATAETIPWLTLSTTSGSGDATVTATVDRTGLATGLHTGYIDVSSNGGFGTIGVTVAATEGGAQLSVSPNPLDFGETTVTIPMSITNVGTGPFQWAINESIPWLDVQQIQGIGDAVVNVNVFRSGLPFGTYTAQFDVNSTGGNITVDVTMEVVDPGPVLSAAPSSFFFLANEANKTLFISNIGTGTLSWSLTDTESWLVTNPSSGTATAGGPAVAVSVSVIRAGLAEGTYNGTIHVSSDGGQTNIPVTMVVSLDPVLSVSPTHLDFGLSTTSLPFTITNTGSGTLTWSVSETVPWISTSPDSGVGSGAVTVTVDRTGLGGGTYTGAIDVTSNGGNATVTVEMMVPFGDGNAGSLCLFTDPNGSSCNFTDTPSSFIPIYVVHTAAANVSAVEFSAPIPSCYGGIWLGDSSPFPLWIGDSQNGIAIGYGQCQSSPIHVLTINTLGLGTSQDCVYPVLPYPNNAFVQAYDCNNQPLAANAGAAYFNSNQPCTCPPTTEPFLSVSPTVLDYGATTTSLNFSITNLGGGTLTWDLSESLSWLTLSETSGSSNAVITALVDRTGLTPGPYSGTIDVTSNGGNATVTVQMDVEGPPVLSVAPTDIFFGETSTIQIFNIMNTGGGVLSWVLDETVPWLDASPDSADGDATVGVTVDRTGLAAGTYMGTINVLSNGGNETVTATMTVPQPMPELTVIPTSKSLGWNEDSFNMVVYNTGTGTLTWSITSTEPWLSATPANGTDDTSVLVEVDRTGLSDGMYTGMLQVTSNGGNADVTVFMSVQSSPVLSLNPTTLIFNTTAQTRTFDISNDGPGTLSWAVVPSRPWIDVTPAGGSGDVTISVTLDPDSMGGETTGEIDVISNGGNGTVSVSFVTTTGQAGFLGVYADPGGTLCTAPDVPNGFLPVYIIHQATPGATAVSGALQSSFPGGFVLLGETSPYPTTIGSWWIHDEGLGGVVAYGGCFASPNLVTTVNLLTLGVSPPCATLCIVPDPQTPSGTIEVVDCASNKLIGSAGCLFVNPDASCNSCGPAVAVEARTWGQIKAQFVDDWDTPQWRAKQKR